MAIARPPGKEFDHNWPESAEWLTLDFGPFESVHCWKQMPECAEFVGARFDLSTFLDTIIVLYIKRKKLEFNGTKKKKKKKKKKSLN